MKAPDKLRRNLRSNVAKLSLEKSFRFQQNNDPKHTARATKECLLYNALRQLTTPPPSPDLNPNEHLWAIVHNKIRKNRISRNNASPETAHIVVHSMPGHLQAVITAKDMHAKY